MSKKVEYIFTALVLLSLILGSSGCSISFHWPPTPPPPTSSPPGSSTDHANPNWTLPSGNNQPAILLPSIADVVKQVMPSVVSVTTEMVVRDFFGREHTQTAAGSGVIIDDEGYIVTNNHVVENAKSVQVKLANGKAFIANIVGADALSDLAVLKIDASDLVYARLGDSDSLVVGDWVVAIGNALGQGISAAEGIVSKLNVSVTVQGNTLSVLIQTTAPINPGNSGGPLVNMDGEVIGITSAKLAGLGIEGMGYAISINSAEPIIKELINKGYVEYPWLGVTTITIVPSIAAKYNLSVDKGALIIKTDNSPGVFPGSPAEIAGLKEGDVIIRFNDKEIDTNRALGQVIENCDVGDEVEITYVRGTEKPKITTATLDGGVPPWG